MPTPNAHPASQRGAESSLGLALFRAAFRVLHAVAPGLALAWATRAAIRPRRHERPQREEDLLRRGHREVVDAGEGHLITTWRFGAAPRKVLLVHGWEGRGAQLGAFVDPLLDAGFEVVLFDHIGHGESVGRRSSVIRFRDGIRAVAQSRGPFHGCIAHSMGAAATTLAMEGGVTFERVVFVAPPWDLASYIERFVALMTGVRGLAGRILGRFEQHYGVRADEVSMSALVPRRSEPLLVLHDLGDRDVPLHEGRRVSESWKGAGLMEGVGLGHRRILRDPDMVRRGTLFLAGEAKPR